jgi:uroporphyrinogen-III synthase
VLNTRPREQAAELSRLVLEAGFEPVEAPAIDTVPAWDEAELYTVQLGLQAAAFDWVVLPSANSGRRLRGELGSARVMCGTATARALAIDAEIELERFSAAAALAALQPILSRGERILLPRAAEGRDELLVGLRALGAEVIAPVAYRTVSVNDAAAALASQHVDVVTLCSPSAVASCVGRVGTQRLTSMTVVCLGETTARAAREAGVRVDAVARSTAMRSLVNAVVAVLAQRKVVA